MSRIGLNAIVAWSWQKKCASAEGGCHLYLGGPQGVGFHEVQGVHGTRAQHKGPQVPHGTGDLGWQEYQVVLQTQSWDQAGKISTALHSIHNMNCFGASAQKIGERLIRNKMGVHKCCPLCRSKHKTSQVKTQETTLVKDDMHDKQGLAGRQIGTSPGGAYLANGYDFY